MTTVFTPLIPTREPDTALSPSDLTQLTLWKWQYRLTGLGFEPIERRRLCFQKWLRIHGRLES